MFPLKDDIPTRRFPVVTTAIIVACVLVYFLVEQGGWQLGPEGSERVSELGAIPYEITHPGEQVTAGGATWWVTIFTSMFLHGSFLHLAGNMLFLWIFGGNVEDAMGRVRFVAFYLLGGVAALGAQVLVDPSSTVPTVGASGAIAGVLGGYALLYPRARVITLIFIVFFVTIVELPALLVLGLWIVMQIAFGLADVAQPTGGEAGGVAYFAHIGGFLFGLAAIKLFARDVREDYETRRRIPVY
jgi:membrane associated rhomboid family serine protease